MGLGFKAKVQHATKRCSFELGNLMFVILASDQDLTVEIVLMFSNMTCWAFTISDLGFRVDFVCQASPHFLVGSLSNLFGCVAWKFEGLMGFQAYRS